MVTLRMELVDGFICLRNLTMLVTLYSRGAGEVAGGHVGAQQGARDAGHQAHHKFYRAFEILFTFCIVSLYRNVF